MLCDKFIKSEFSSSLLYNFQTLPPEDMKSNGKAEVTSGICFVMLSEAAESSSLIGAFSVFGAWADVAADSLSAATAAGLDSSWLKTNEFAFIKF